VILSSASVLEDCVQFLASCQAGTIRCVWFEQFGWEEGEYELVGDLVMLLECNDWLKLLPLHRFVHMDAQSKD
jgi:hypothetical protein